jgi:transcription antitermination protein NusB
MQMLYALGRDKDLKIDDALRHYREQVSQSFELYLFNLLYFLRVAEFSLQDAATRRAKLRPSEEDKRFNSKLADNPLLSSLRKNEAFHKLVVHYKLQDSIDADHVRGFYTEFAKKEEYQAYLLSDREDNESHLEILLALYKYLSTNELFVELNEDRFSHWPDDESLIVGSMKKTIKALPADTFFFEAYRPNKETTVDFGEVLLRKVHKEDADLLKIIEPTLKNWDVERVAAIDMILIKMALVELMTFTSIPPKVSLNEFVEIAKNYSTDKSKEFINGILDRLLKQLENEGKIQKEGRGLLDE